MSSKTVHLAVYDTLADWETGHLTAHLRGNEYHRAPRDSYEIRTVGLRAGDPVTTAGGMRVLPDLAIEELRPADSSLLILPGAGLWDTSDELAPFARKAREFLDAGVPVAAICGATAGLAREGLLDERRHTSAVSYYLAELPGYKGHALYVEAAAVLDRDLITAGPTEPVAFAREAFKRLGTHEPAVLEAWERLFADSDGSAFEVLMEAAQK